MNADDAREVLDVAAAELAEAEELERDAHALRLRAIKRICSISGDIGNALRDARSQRMSAAQLHRHARNHATPR